MIRTRLLTVAAILLGGTLAGCGPQELKSAGPEPRHGGTLQELPDGAGYVELVVEPADPAIKGARAKGRVLAVFVNPDGSAPPSPAPTDVTFTDEKGKSHSLSPAEAAGTFASEPVALPIGADPTGTLAAKLGGKDVSIINRPR